MSTLTRRLILIAALVTGAIVVSARLPKAAPTETLASPPTPLNLGDWQGETYDLEDQVRAIIPEARFLTRTYTAPGGRVMDFAVLTTPLPSQLHDPRFCFQSQGWQVLEQRQRRLWLGGRSQAVGWCRVSSQGEEAEALYAFLSPGVVSTGDWRFHLSALSGAARGQAIGPARFVRVLWQRDQGTLA